MGADGAADPVVLAGRAETCLAIGRQREAAAAARALQSLSSVGPELERAERVLTVIHGAEMRQVTGRIPRLDVVAALRSARDVFAAVGPHRGRAIWSEIGLLGASGIRADSNQVWQLTSYPNHPLRSIEMLAWLYAGTRLYAPDALHLINLDFSTEWRLAELGI
jgi:hypothetical protein